jgi:hypothetical protein
VTAQLKRISNKQVKFQKIASGARGLNGVIAVRRAGEESQRDRGVLQPIKKTVELRALETLSKLKIVIAKCAPQKVSLCKATLFQNVI